MNLDAQLTQLENAQLVHRADNAELAYQFKHALTQDAAYVMLLKRDRVRLHQVVAQAYENLYADRLDDYAALLAQHFAQAGDDPKTLAYATRAGDVASRVFANGEAVAFYTHALEIARQTGSVSSEQLEYLYRRRGRELELASQFKAALAGYGEMENLAGDRGDRVLELSAVVAQCQLLCTANSEFNPEMGEPLAQRALLLARDLSDRVAESKIQWILLNLYRFTDRFDQARQAGEESLAIARQLDLREQMAFTLNDLPHVYLSIGEPSLCGQALQEAIRLWRELGNLPMLADSLSSTAFSDSFFGHYDQLVAYADEAYRISQSIGNLWGQTYSLSTVGVAYWARGEPDRAIATMKETLRLTEQSGYLIPQVITRADLAVVFANLGATGRGMEAARLALACAETHYVTLRPYAAAMLVQVQILSGDIDGAAATVSAMNDTVSDQMFSMLGSLSRFQLAFAQASYTRVIEMGHELLERVRKLGLGAYSPDVLYLIGRAYWATGNFDAARTTLDQARVEAETRNMRRIAWQIDIALGDVEAQDGNTAKANIAHAHARDAIKYIAAHAPEDLRSTFLVLPDVRKVMETK
jgi:tetratricopeptide (TPR) repeat protein